MRALFLGSGGRVGTLLRHVWSSTDVTAIWHARQGGDVSFDITSDQLGDAVDACDVVVNLAGTTHHGATAFQSNNTALARHVLDHAQGKSVILMSSAAIYGMASGALTETLAPTPVSDYGRDKAQMEEMALAHDTRSVVLRLGNVAGADALLGTDRETYMLDQFADGTTPARSYIGPHLLARTLAGLIVKFDTLPPILNVATPAAVSMGSLLHAANKPFATRSAGPDAIKRVELETTLLESLVTMPPDAARPRAIINDWSAV